MGATGEALKILGYYATLGELQAADPVGVGGEGYVIGAGLLYVWSVTLQHGLTLELFLVQLVQQDQLAQYQLSLQQ
jgi:hypothetical protein